MTERLGVLGKLQTLLAMLGTKAPAEAPPAAEQEALVRLPRLLVGVASPDLKPLQSIKLTVDAMSPDELTCKSRELLAEGTRLNLELLLQGVGHVKLPVVVDWVLLSSFGHSAGLKVLHTEESRELLQEYLRLVKENLR